MKRILVVEDNSALRTVVAEVLTDEGYGVDTAANGAEALAKVREDPPDAVVCDLMLPVLDGQGFVEACRGDPAGRAIPVLLVSSVDTVATVAQRLPVQGYLSKPFDLENLVATVDALASATAQGS